MDGDARSMDVLAYLSRLKGGSIGLDDTIQLRSIERAAFGAWANQQTPPIALPGLSSAARTVRQILGVDPAADHAARPAMAPASTPLPGRMPVGGIGIDIEHSDALPQTQDYREHPFFQDSFTPAEIAHCLRQRDARSAFCGLWAAKEAIFKAGLCSGSNPLRTLEITHDDVGRPCFPGAMLSISHAAGMAVAVCVVAPVPTLPTLPVAVARPVPVEAPPKRAVRDRMARPAFRAAAVVLGMSTVALAAVALAGS